MFANFCACCMFLITPKFRSVVFRCCIAFSNDKDVFLWTLFLVLFSSNHQTGKDKIPVLVSVECELWTRLIRRKRGLKGFLCTIDLISAPGFQEQVELDLVGVHGETNARTAQLFGGLVNPNFYSDVGAVLFGCPRDVLRRVRKNLKSKPHLWNTVRNYQNKSVSAEVCLLVRSFVCCFFVRSCVCLFMPTRLSAFLSVFGFRRPVPNLFFSCEHSRGNSSRVAPRPISFCFLLLHAMGVAVLCEVAVSASKPAEKQFWFFSYRTYYKNSCFLETFVFHMPTNFPKKLCSARLK